MSVCQKCWADARALGLPYSFVLMQRRDTPCTPEEQAGPDARECPMCHRKTLHQYTGAPMCGCAQGKDIAERLPGSRHI